MSETFIWDQTPGEPTPIMSLEEYEQYKEAERKKQLKNLKYQKYHKNLKILKYYKEFGDNEVDLEYVNCEKDFLFWIIHLHSKRWMTCEAFSELVIAMKALFPKLIPAYVETIGNEVIVVEVDNSRP